MRIEARPVEVYQDGTWLPGLLRSWEVDDDGHESGIVSFTDTRNEIVVGRFSADRIRDSG